MAITVKETPVPGFETADFPETDTRDPHPPRKITAIMATDASPLLGCLTGDLSAVSIRSCRVRRIYRIYAYRVENRR